MALVDVFGDVSADHFRIILEGIEVGIAELSSHLETNMEKLAEMLVVGQVVLIVPERPRILLARPGMNFPGTG